MNSAQGIGSRRHLSARHQHRESISVEGKATQQKARQRKASQHNAYQHISSHDISALSTGLLNEISARDDLNIKPQHKEDHGNVVNAVFLVLWRQLNSCILLLKHAQSHLREQYEYTRKIKIMIEICEI
jgi:hypothetical protein